MGSKEKKRPKKAFQGRKKKRDRTRSRKKGSKKPRRLEDSYSQSNDDSSSAYSSEEDVKRRSSRSQVRKDGKGRKRKARSSSSSSDRSFESPHAKKIKRSKRKVEGGKKKAGKKNRRALSVSSASSDESDYEKSRGSSKKKVIGRRSGKEGKGMRGSKKYRSLSYSSSSPGSASEGERKRKRERSPSSSSLSINSESESERKRKRYWSPSALSGGSASGDQHIQDELEVQNKPTWKLRSIIVVPEIPDQDTMSDEHEDDFAMRDEYDEWSTKSNIADRDEQIKESIDRTKVMLSVPDDEDLESILRRKALENLKRFKGGPKKAGKSDKMETSVQEVKQMRESENVDDLEDIGASDMKHSFSSDEESYLIIGDSSKVVDQVSTLEKNEVFATSSRAMENASVKHHVEIEMGGSESAQLSNDSKVVPKAAAQIADSSSLTLPADTESNNGESNNGDNGASKHIAISHTGKPVSDSFLMSQEPVAACPTMDPKLPPPECLDATPELSKCSEDKRGNVPIEKFKPKSVSHSVEPSSSDNPSSSLPIDVAGDHASSEHQAESKESLQFQEKTMSVMRGGELVQVSYKVYIPKKAPAAARRRLKR